MKIKSEITGAERRRRPAGGRAAPVDHDAKV
jgi:hypothetical protein